jgi:hypothetical protein
LRKIIGGNTMAKKMTKATGKEITKLFTEITIKMIGRMNNTPRSISSLRLVTDVR